MRLLGILEIILRNRFHATLSQYAWDPNTSVGIEHSNDWYMKLYRPFGPGGGSTSDKNLKKKIGSLGNPASPNKVIAGMTYGFWPHVLDKLSDNAGVAVPWDTLIPKILPNHHQQDATYWGVQAHQDALFARIELVGDLRNRVAHFEPLWKFGVELSETRARQSSPRTLVAAAPTTIPETLKRLRLSYRKTTQLLNWLSKSRAAEYRESENHQALEWLMTEDSLSHFKNLPAHQKVRLSSLTKAWGLKSELQSTKFAVVTYKNVPIGRYYSAPL